jgi:SMC interacting uncharacterized protein involved in chromosome segregation
LTGEVKPKAFDECRFIKEMESEKADYLKKIELYKDQVKRMRENIDLFKQNIQHLQEKNDSLTMKMNSRPSH